MANVGNLFVNISGSTKGLTKALTSAKGEIASFDKKVGRKRGDSLRRARGRSDAARAETARLGGTTHSGRIRATLRKEKETRRAYRQEQRSSVMSKMGSNARMSMAASLAVVGLTIAALSSMFNTARQQAKSAEQGVDQFKYIGPMGGRIMQEEIGMKLDAMKAAQDPEVSRQFLDKAKQARSAQRTSIEAGGMGASMNWDMFVSSTGEAFTQALSAVGLLPTAGPDLSRNTGPTGTTGNTGGP